MKIFIKKLIAVAIFFIGNACNDDFLEPSPQDRLGQNDFWSTELDAREALTGLYGRLGEKGTVWDNWTTYLWAANCMTEDAVVNERIGDVDDAFQNGTLNATNDFVEALWGYWYTNIRMANLFLANISRPEMTEDLRKRLTAEARLLRAYAYSLLVRNWGGVPLVIKPLTLEELKVPRNTKKEVVDFIVAQLDSAAADLPVAYQAKSDKGRVTKGFALALKAQTLLYDGQYEQAAAAAKSVIDLGEYELFQDEDGTGYYTLGQKANEDNKEVIFAIRYQLEDMFHWFQARLYPRNHTGGDKIASGFGVLQAFVNAFETTNGKTIPLTPPRKNGNILPQSVPGSTADPNNPLYDPSDPFKNRDPRLAMSVLKPGDQLIGGTLSGETVNNPSFTGYYPRKLYFSNYSGWGRYDIDLILMRYAEVLLIYAESKIELGQIDQSALNAINDVRARAYGAKRDETSRYPAIVTMDQAELRAIVRRERHVELGMEFNDTRLQDIRRWKIAPTVMNGESKGALLNGVHRKVSQLRFEAPKNYLWPIPQKEIDLTGTILEQNTGY